jgi:ligand-binding sensor domain-containing protein
VYKDSRGHIWFGTAALGAGRYNGKTFDWLLEEDVTELHDGPANGVRSVVEDAEGNFWFNANYKYAMNDGPITAGGKFYTRIKSIGGLDGKPNDILSEYLSCVRDSQGHLWFATYSLGAWKYDGKQVTHYPVQVNGQDIHLFYVYEDNAGTLWLGTHENGAFRFNGSAFEPFGD